MGAYPNPALFDPRQLRRWGQPDMYAPAPSPSPAPETAEPQVQPENSFDQGIHQAEQRFQDRSGQFDQALSEYDRQRLMQPSPHRSVAGRIGEAAVSFFSPQAAHAIWEEPYQRKMQGWEQGMNTAQHELGTLHQASQDALSDVRAQEQEKRVDAYYQHALKPNAPEVKTQVLVGPEGKPHVYSHNPQTGRFDIDQGEAYERPQHEPVVNPPAPHTVQTASGVQQWDPETKTWKRIGGLPKEVPAASNAQDKPRRGTPAQFANVQARKDAAEAKFKQRFHWAADEKNPKGGRYEDRSTADEMSPDDFNGLKQDIQNSYEQQIIALGGEPSHYEYGNEPKVEPPGAPSPVAAHGAANVQRPQAKVGETRTVKGVPYRFDGRQWVLQQAGAGNIPPAQ